MNRSPLIGRDALPTEVVIGGRAFPISSDFRAGIAFEQILADDSIPDGIKLVLALDAWYPEGWPKGDLNETIDATMDFYRCGKPEVNTSKRRLYDFGHDYDMIYSAFLGTYRIDLFDVEYLHWWRFRAMLSDLPGESQFVRAIGYRSASIVKGMSDEQKKHVREMKRLYALPTTDEAPGFKTEADFKEWLASQQALIADRMATGGDDAAS